MKPVSRFFILSLIILMVNHNCVPDNDQNFEQSPDSDYEWLFTKECWPENITLEIFIVIEQAPVIYGISLDQLKADIDQLIKDNSVNSSNNLEFKIKIFSLIDYGICVEGIGVKNDENVELSKKLFDYFDLLNDIDLGMQVGIQKNCLSEIYIYTKENSLHDIRFYNLRFDD